MSGRDPQARLAPALAWVARLPLLGDRELAGLLGVHEQDVRAARLELERRCWTDWIVPGAPGLAPRRLSYLRPGALAPLAEAAGVPAEQLPERAAVRRSQLLERATRVEITAAVNRFLANVAAAARDAGDELADARSLPLAGAAADRLVAPGRRGLRVRARRQVVGSVLRRVGSRRGAGRPPPRACCALAHRRCLHSRGVGR